MNEAMHEFQYNLEKHLFDLYQDINNGTYRHGMYKSFMVCDNKRRKISVSSVRDRVVHRLLYDYLVPIWDKTFIYDAWSCRKGKGLLSAIERAQNFLKLFPNAYVWRADIQKFFDHVDQGLLFRLLKKRIKDHKMLFLIRETLKSYQSFQKGIGMPIGNLTSQIFSNIYLNELDRFVKHKLKPKAYLRYGDDFLLFEMDVEKLKSMKEEVISFLSKELKLTLHTKNNVLVKVNHGLKFLGLQMWSSGRRLSKRNKARILSRLNIKNISSYHGLMTKHGNSKYKKCLDWHVFWLMEANIC